MRAYHFTSDTLRDGTPIPPIGVPLLYEGKLKLCEKGLHASRHPFDALRYAPGKVLHLVDCAGIEEEQEDKFVCSSRTILKTIDATQTVGHFARACALDVAHLWECPGIVREFLETGREDIRVAAKEAAWVSWWIPDKGTVWNNPSSAAMAAAWAAAGAAAWHTAWDAAWDANREEGRERQREAFLVLVTEEFNK